MQPIEEHDFYQRIRWIVYILGGGWIRRNKSEQSGKCVGIYCMLCIAITCGTVIRLLLFFSGDLSVETENLFAYLIVCFFCSRRFNSNRIKFEMS